MKKLIGIVIVLIIQQSIFNVELSFAQAPFLTPDNIGTGNCLDFDGVDDYLDLGAPTSLTNLGVGDFTLEAWIFPHTLHPTNMDVFFSSRNGSSHNKIQIGIDSEYLKFDRYPSGGGAVNTSPAKVNTGEWSHVVVVLREDDDEVDLYINGIKYTKAYTEEYSGGTPTMISIGAQRLGGGTQLEYNGLIDEVRIWDHARNQTEIRDDMCKRLTGNETGLVGYWRMNEGTGSTVSDLTTNANHGTRQ